MSKKCMTCRFFKSSHCRGVCTLLLCTTTPGEWCRNHEERILLDHITASAKVLAEKLVYQFIAYDRHGLFVSCWRSTLTGDIEYSTRAEAIAATIKELEKAIK